MKSKKLLSVGMVIDAMDDYGLWNTAYIRKIEGNRVFIEYEGWPKEWNEWIGMDSHRILPLHTFTKIIKCWANGPTLSWWPALANIRAPGNEEGMAALKEEDRIFVEFLDGSRRMNRKRMWLNVADVKALSQQPGSAARSETERKKFQAAVLLCEKATAESPSTMDMQQGTLLRNIDECSEKLAKEVKKNVSREDFKAASSNRDSVHSYLCVQSKAAMVKAVLTPKENIVEAETKVETKVETEAVTEAETKAVDVNREQIVKPLVLSPSKVTGQAYTKYLEISSPNRVSRPLKRKNQKANAAVQSSSSSSTKFPRRGSKGDMNLRACEKSEELTETVADQGEVKGSPQDIKSWSITNWIHKQFKATSPESLSSVSTKEKVDNISFQHMRKSSHPKHKNQLMHSVTSTSNVASKLPNDDNQ